MASFIGPKYEYWFEKYNFECSKEGQVSRRDGDIIVFGNCHFLTWLIMTSNIKCWKSYKALARPKLIGNFEKSLVKGWNLIIYNRQMIMMMIKMRRLLTKKELIQVERKTTNLYI